MTDGPSIAISFETVFAKSKVYIGKALRRKAENDFEEYQLWASLALELLGKSALAHKHPCLVVDPTHTPSLFVAAGLAVTTDVKTIGAKTLFDRLKQVEPLFDVAVSAFCLEISERRNSELHSGDLPFKAMKTEEWEARYWHACHVILSIFSCSLEQWLGAKEAKTPKAIVQAKKHATYALVLSKIEAARQGFLALPQKQREQRHRAAAEAPALPQLFQFLSDHHWQQQCPACSGTAFLGGDQTHEEIKEDAYGNSLWETVEKTYYADEFVCPSCSLELFGSEQLEAAKLDLYHSEEEERQIQYEPDYGNC